MRDRERGVAGCGVPGPGRPQSRFHSRRIAADDVDRIPRGGLRDREPQHELLDAAESVGSYGVQDAQSAHASTIAAFSAAMSFARSRYCCAIAAHE